MSGIKSQVEAMPWYIQAQEQSITPPPTANDIGTEVGDALKPQLYGIKEELEKVGDKIVASWNAFASMFSGGVKKQINEALDDPATIAKLRSRVS